MNGACSTSSRLAPLNSAGKAGADRLGLEPEIIISGIDTDVCKTYVPVGMGIAILATMAYDPERDTGIAARPLGHLMPTSTVQIVLRSNTYWRPFLLEGIRSIAPHLTPTVVRQAVQNFQNARV